MIKLIDLLKEIKINDPNLIKIVKGEGNTYIPVDKNLDKGEIYKYSSISNSFRWEFEFNDSFGIKNKIKKILDSKGILYTDQGPRLIIDKKYFQEITNEVKINKPGKLWDVDNTIVKVEDVEIGDKLKMTFRPEGYPPFTKIKTIIDKIYINSFNPHLVDDEDNHWSDFYLRNWYDEYQKSKKQK